MNRQLRDRLPAGVRTLGGRLLRAARAGSSPADTDPKPPALSVIVPIYDVERYVAACLDSIVSQSFSDFELIVVDDGSPDGSRAIAESYAASDPRVRIVEQANAGLGAARNYGLGFARGEFVAFADSDDIVRPDAYRRMVRTLRRSGSDFVVGSFVRGSETKVRSYPWVRRVHHDRRLGITVDDLPEVMLDITAWNKVFRRDFVESHGLRFPVGVRYEDQLPLTRAYLTARAFDVDTKVVYLWRERDEGSSITQQKSSLTDLRDRLAALRATRAEVDSHASPTAREYWFTKLLGYDLPGYLEAAVFAEDEYWSELAEFLGEIRPEIDEPIWNTLPAYERVMAYLLVHGDRDTARAVFGEYERDPGRWPTEKVAGRRRFVRTPALAHAEVPDSILALGRVDTQPYVHLDDIAWLDDDRLEFTGVALLPGIDDDEVDVGLVAIHDATGEEVAFELNARTDPLANVLAQRKAEDHADAGFVARIDARALTRAADGPVGRWRLEARLGYDGDVRRGGFSTADRQGAFGVGETRIVDGRMVDVTGTAAGGLAVRVASSWAILDDGAVDPDGLVRLHVRTPPEDPAMLVVARAPDGDAVELGSVDEHGDVSFSVPSQAAPGDRLRVRLRSGGEIRLVMPPTLDVLARDHRPPPIVRDTAGRPVLNVDPYVVIDGVDAAVDGFVLTGRASTQSPVALALRGDRTEVPAGTVEAGPFRIKAVALADPWGLGRAPLPANTYTVSAVDPAVIAAAAAALRLRGHEWFETAGYRWRTGSARGALALSVVTLPDDVRSLYGRTLTEREAAREGRSRLLPVVLFECFDGRFAGDSPMAIARALRAAGTDLRLVWSVVDRSVHVPDEFDTVVKGSREWFRLLYGARYLVNNNNFPPTFTKSPGQTYLQTWHGTPLKRIGLDIVGQDVVSGRYLRTMDREATYWDHLVSPSPYCSEIFPRAFGYTGDVLETGYPRNDVLVDDGAPARRVDVRRRLGLPEDARVILYAPTWRENARRDGVPQRALFLPPDRLVGQVPDTYLLVRAHANTARAASIETATHPRVLDVTLYPDVSDLYLAADELITDYSSVMFDFAVLNRPIHLLVPDLDDYRDRARGFYFDIEEHAPGLIHRHPESLLADLAAGPSAPAASLAAFRERFCPYDDGHASERVVAAVWGKQNPDVG